MVVLKYKRVAATDNKFTQDQVYTVLMMGDEGVVFVDDNSNMQPQSFSSHLNDPAEWELVSIHQQQLVQIYP